jgi:hypothetical protein
VILPTGEQYKMAFIKHGDGKILSVVLDEEELTAEQKKKAASELAKQVIKQSDTSDTSNTKKSGS